MFNYYRASALTVILLVSLVIPSGAAFLSQTQAENQVRVFLQQLDQGQQDKAWQAMSAFFQSINDRRGWKTRHQFIRSSYGSLIARELKNISYRRTFNQAPDGEYVIVQFRSAFLNKAESRETVVLDCSEGTECSVREYVIQ